MEVRSFIQLGHLKMFRCTRCSAIVNPQESAGGPLWRCFNCGEFYDASGARIKSNASAYPYASQPQPLYPDAPAAQLHPVRFRQSAHDKVAMPALLLQVWGGVLLAIGLLLMVMAGTAPLLARRDMLEAIVLPGIFSTAYVGSGSFLFYGGYCLRQLRFHGHIMAAVFFGLMTNIILCMPLICLAIWPLIVIFDPEIKQAFELAKSEPPR